MESDDVASGAVGPVSYVNQKNARMRAHTHMHIPLLYDYIYVGMDCAAVFPFFGTKLPLRPKVASRVGTTAVL